MDALMNLIDTESETPDRQVLLLMLSYVEAECRRLGASDAADHAARAANSLPDIVIDATSQVPPRPRNMRLH